MLDKILLPEPAAPVTPIACGTHGLGMSIAGQKPVPSAAEKKLEEDIRRRIKAVAKKRGI